MTSWIYVCVCVDARSYSNYCCYSIFVWARVRLYASVPARLVLEYPPGSWRGNLLAASLEAATV